MQKQKNIENDFITKKRYRKEIKSSPDRVYSLRNRINSEIKKDISSFEISQCKTITATETDFRHPLEFFDSLWNSNEDSTGVIKILPPNNWKNVNDYTFQNFYFPYFLKCEKKIETRIQDLNGLLEGKKFKFIKNLTFKEYQDEANQLEMTIYPTSNSIEKIEEDFWNYCHSKIENKSFETKYAADISYSTFFSKKDLDKKKSYLNKNKTWNLCSIHAETDSLFQFLSIEKSSQISGLTIPWVYFGMLFSTFCWHVEDLYMYSLNYMYYGKPKIWYSVSHSQKELLDLFIKNKKLDLNIEDQNILHRLILLIDPKELIKSGIKVYKAIQSPGEIIFTLPKAYHSGFSTGFNISEAVNLAVLII